MGDHGIESTSLDDATKKRKFPSDATMRQSPFFYYTDHSKDIDEDPFSMIIQIGHKMNLPCKMHVILDRPDFVDIVSWMPHSRSWKIHKPDEFESKVLPQYWSKCTFKSFVRQVSHWGFLRISKGKDKGCYYNEYFLRGMPHLCKKMVQTDKLDAKEVSKRKLVRKLEPDLYAISEIHPVVPHETCADDMDRLNTVFKDGPNARMHLKRTTAADQGNVVQCISPPLDDEKAQDELSLSSPLQEPEQENEELLPKLTMMTNILQRQHLLSLWQSFISSFMLLGVGTAMSWEWLTRQFVRNGTVPIFTDVDQENEMECLSDFERLNAKADIHGSLSEAEATEHEERIAIGMLHSEMMKLPRSEKAIFDEACTHCSEFAGDEWLLLFLYSENFNAAAAARRVVIYWQLRMDTMGPERAFLQLTINNVFCKEHIQCLRFGLLRIIPVCDLHGRPMIVVEPGRIHGIKYDPVIMLRVVFYMLHAVLDHPNARKNGVVILVDFKTIKPGSANFSFFTGLNNIFVNFPFRIKAMHICNVNKPALVLLLNFGRFFANTYFRSRMEIHKGSDSQVSDQLEQFGLTPDRLPIELGGIIELDHEKWIEERISKGL